MLFFSLFKVEFVLLRGCFQLNPVVNFELQVFSDVLESFVLFPEFIEIIVAIFGNHTQIHHSFPGLRSRLVNDCTDQFNPIPSEGSLNRNALTIDIKCITFDVNGKRGLENVHYLEGELMMRQKELRELVDIFEGIGIRRCIISVVDCVVAFGESVGDGDDVEQHRPG